MALSYTGLWESKEDDPDHHGFLTMNYGVGKTLFVLAITLAQANLWMSERVARAVKPFFIAPDLSWLLVAVEPEKRSEAAKPSPELAQPPATLVGYLASLV